MPVATTTEKKRQFVYTLYETRAHRTTATDRVELMQKLMRQIIDEPVNDSNLAIIVE